MPTLYGDRQQMYLPSTIEEYVREDDPVRAYDAFINHLAQQGEVQFELPSYEGRPEYDPLTLLKLLVYSYSYGIRSSRQIEKACVHNLSYVWLTGGLHPDYRTIAQFRKDHKELLKKLLKKCVKICIKLNLIDGNVLFVDGSKIRANASSQKSWTQAKCEKVLIELDQHIDQLLKECDSVDQQEQVQSSSIRMPEDLKGSKALQQKIKQALEELKNKEQKKINLTDPDCNIMKGRGGVHASYNLQQGVDEKHALIVSTDPVSDANDRKQLSAQTQNANNNLGRPVQTVCGDSGYANTQEMEKVESGNVQPIVPSQTQAQHQDPSPFHHDRFTYNEQKDSFRCPEGKILTFSGIQKPGISKCYRLENGSICQACPHFGKCTSSPRGRTIARMFNEPARKHFEEIYNSSQGQQIYKKRKEKAEHPFGFIKRILKADHFLLRRLSGVRAEASLLATCFDITRMITILGGVSQFIAKLKLLET